MQELIHDSNQEQTRGLAKNYIFFLWISLPTQHGWTTPTTPSGLHHSCEGDPLPAYLPPPHPLTCILLICVRPCSGPLSIKPLLTTPMKAQFLHLGQLRASQVLFYSIFLTGNRMQEEQWYLKLKKKNLLGTKLLWMNAIKIITKASLKKVRLASFCSLAPKYPIHIGVCQTQIPFVPAHWRSIQLTFR